VFKDPRFDEEHRLLHERGEAWVEAIANRLERTTSKSARQSLKLAYAANLCQHQFTCDVFFKDPLYWYHDSTRDSCMEVVRLYREFLDHLTTSQWEANYEYGGYLTSMSHIARRCPDYLVRQQAMAISWELVDMAWNWDHRAVTMSTAALLYADEALRDDQGELPLDRRYFNIDETVSRTFPSTVRSRDTC
jgi:hypothetical protein